MTSPFILSASSLAPDVGVDAAAAGGAGALGTAAAAAPYVAIPAAIAAYAFSPTVRSYVNNTGRQLMGSISNMRPGFMTGLLGDLDPTGRLPSANAKRIGMLNQNAAINQANQPPIPPHEAPIAYLTRAQYNPNVAYTPSPALPPRSFY